MAMKRLQHTTSRLLAIAAAAAVGVGLTGCRENTSDNPPREFFPDLDNQEKNKAQSVSHFFDEFTDEEGESFGRTAREPVEGSVPWGWQPHVGTVAEVDFAKRDMFAKEDAAVFTGRTSWAADAPLIDRIPVPVTEELLELGRHKYEVICILCHGGTGAGDGMVGRRWAYALPTFHDAQYQPGGEKGQDGHIFDVIRNGVAGLNPGELKMPAYDNKLDEYETWAVVAYVRALQLSRSAPYKAEYADDLRNAPVIAPANAGEESAQ